MAVAYYAAVVAPGYQPVAQDAVALDTVAAVGLLHPKGLDGVVGHHGDGGNIPDKDPLVADAAYGAGACAGYTEHCPPFVGVHIVLMRCPYYMAVVAPPDPFHMGAVVRP